MAYQYTDNPAADYDRWSDPLARDWDRHATRVDRRVRELRTNPEMLQRAVAALDADTALDVLQRYFEATMHTPGAARAVDAVIDAVVADELPMEQEDWIDER